MFNQNSLLDLFAQSPIGPLQQHMAAVHKAVSLLRPFIDAAINDDHAAMERYYSEISDCEHAADALKYDLRAHLPRSIFLPVPRGDILDLLRTQDKLANTAKDVAGTMLGRRMEISSEIAELLLPFVDRCIDTSSQTHETISHLQALQESGFHGKEVSHVETMIRHIDEIEHETDELQIPLRRALFAMEEHANPIDIMFMYQIIDAIGQIADLAQSTGHRLLLLMSS